MVRLKHTCLNCAAPWPTAGLCRECWRLAIISALSTALVARLLDVVFR
jgi:hypothetical protein